MNPKIKTQDVTRSLYTNYLKRSDECFRAAIESFSKDDWNAAAICAIHSCISACDALCIYFLGKRHAGSNHGDAVILLNMIKGGNAELTNNVNRLRKILGVKNMAEYEERLIRRSEAEKVMKDAERLIAFVKSQSTAIQNFGLSLLTWPSPLSIHISL